MIYKINYYQILAFCRWHFSIFTCSDTNLSANALNNDPIKINNWAYQWMMSFNPDPSTEAQEVIFSQKIKKPSHPLLIFNNNQVMQTQYQKHLGFFLDEK